MVSLPEVSNHISGTALTVDFFHFLDRAHVQSRKSLGKRMGGDDNNDDDDNDNDNDQYGDDVGRASKRWHGASTEHPDPASQMLRGSQTEDGGAKETSSWTDGCGRLQMAHPLPQHHHRRCRLELRDKANCAIRLPEIIDSAVSLRCEIQDGRDWRASLWRKVVNIVGGGGRQGRVKRAGRRGQRGEEGARRR